MKYFFILIFICTAYTQAQEIATLKLIDEHQNALTNAIIEFNGNEYISDMEGIIKLELALGENSILIDYEGIKKNYYINYQNQNPLLMVVNLDELQLHDVVKTGNHIEKLSPTYNQQNFTKERIEKEQPQSLTDVFKNIAGVTLMGNGNAISRPVIRGMSGNRIALANDGVLVQDQQWGTDHGTSIDVYNADGITLLKGPATLALGSGALGGVVSVHSRSIPNKKTNDFSLNTYYQSNNTMLGLNAQSFIKFEKPWFIESNINYQRYQDFKIPVRSLNIEDSIYNLKHHRLENTSGLLGSASFRFGQKFTHGYWSNKFYISNQKNGIFPALAEEPDAVIANSKDNPWSIALPNQQVQNLYNLIEGEYKWKHFKLNSYLQFQNNKRWERQFPETTGDPTTALFLNQNTLSNLIEIEYHGKKLEFHKGIQLEFIQNRIGGAEYVIPNFKQNSFGIFSVVNYKPKSKWVLSLGARYDHIQLKTQQYILSDADTINAFKRKYDNLSISLGSEFHLNYFSFDFNIARSFRVPNIGELTSKGAHLSAFRTELGNPNLGSEKTWQFDFAFGYKKNNQQLSFSPYFYYFDNYIYLQEQTPILFQYQNNKAQIYGAECSYEGNISEHLHAIFNVDYVRGKIRSLNQNAPAIPPAKIYAELHYEFDSSEKATFHHPIVGLGYTHLFNQNKVGVNELATAGTNLLNIYLITDIELKSNLLKFNFSIDNLFNQKYYNHLSNFRRFDVPEKGRNIKLSVIYQFK